MEVRYSRLWRLDSPASDEKILCRLLGQHDPGGELPGLNLIRDEIHKLVDDALDELLSLGGGGRGFYSGRLPETDEDIYEGELEANRNDLDETDYDV